MNLLGDILDAAMQTREPLAFRSQVLQILRPLGFDDGVFASLGGERIDGLFYGPSSPSGALIDRIRAREAFFYKDLGRYFAHTSVHGVTRDDDPMSYDEFRRTTAFYNELYRPAGIARFVNILVAPPNGSPAMIALVRTSPEAGFTDLESATLKSLRAGLSLADGALRRARHASALASVLLPSDHELIELLVLGYTNKQIATVLQRSPNTIRNRLIRLYARAGVASRTELIGLLALPERPE